MSRFDYIAPIGDEEINAATEVLRSKKLSGFYKNLLGGEKVQQFEKDFAAYMGAKHGVGFNSGTSALHAALAACGVQPGDEVIVPPYTFTATASAVLMNFARPVFVDVDPQTLCMDPGLIEAVVTEKTRAIVPVHLYGKMADMDRIMAVAKRHNLKVIEDACQAPGSLYKGKKAGTIGDCGVFSFVETKNIVIGEGGMVICNEEKTAETVRRTRNHGEAWADSGTRDYLTHILGFNFRMTEIEAAIGIEQLKKLDRFNSIRRENAEYLTEKLKKYDGLNPLEFKSDEVPHIYVLRVDEQKTGLSREEWVKRLTGEGIPVMAGYPRPLYKNPIFQTVNAYVKEPYTDVVCPVTEDVCRRSVWIKQIHTPLTTQDMDTVAAAVERCLQRTGANI